MTRRTLQEIRSARAAQITPAEEPVAETPQCECDGTCNEETVELDAAE